MEDREKEIIQLVLAQEENNQVDFKRCYYADDKKYDLIKDVVSFANNIKNHNKYIIFGIRNSTKEVEGLAKRSCRIFLKLTIYFTRMLSHFLMSK